MKRRVIAFDLDNTLAESKSPINVEMARLFDRLLARFQVCVISGGKSGQFEAQLIDHLNVAPTRLCALHVMPTCGTRYYRFDLAAAAWQQVYAEDLPADKRAAIAAALAKGAAALGFRETKLWGEQIEDRGSQVTFSALGQEAPVASKEAWDPDGAKKRKLRDYVADDLELRAHRRPPCADPAWPTRRLPAASRAYGLMFASRSEVPHLPPRAGRASRPANPSSAA
jgi:hydroxymethylpyrimidine pyrophosphatase-like HAD family hydrolase